MKRILRRDVPDEATISRLERIVMAIRELFREGDELIAGIERDRQEHSTKE